MKINVINGDKLQIQLVAESVEDHEELQKLMTSPHIARSPITFPREDVLNSVKIEVERRQRGY